MNEHAEAVTLFLTRNALFGPLHPIKQPLKEMQKTNRPTQNFWKLSKYNRNLIPVKIKRSFLGSMNYFQHEIKD